MNVIMVGTDRKVFEQASSVRARMIDYGTLFDELHIVVFAQKSLGFKPEQIASNVWIYPSQSRSPFLYIKDSISLIKKLFSQKSWTKDTTTISCQDPFETGLVGVQIKKQFGIKLQIQIHTDLLSPYFVSQSLKNRIRISFSKYTLPKADGIRVVSQRIKNSLVKHLPKISKSKINVLPIYTNTTIIDKPITTNLKERYPQFTRRILMASRLTKEKNIPLAIKAFSKLHKEYAHVGMIIVGSGPEERYLKNMVNNLDLNDSIIFEPWQPELASYYKTADLFLLTSLYEGYCLTLIEASLCKLPSIATDVGIVNDILRPNESVMVTSSTDEPKVAEDISNLLSNKVFSQTLGHNAFTAIQHSVITDKTEYLKIYKELLLK